jgi:hypothetical protein
MMPDLHQMAMDHQVGGTHYANKTIQPWEFMESVMTEEQFEGYIRGNVIKYLSRYPEKGGRLDLEKAKHYLDKLLEIV